MSDDHDALVAVCRRWEALVAEKDADIARLSEIAKEALAMHLAAEDERDAAVAENVRLREKNTRQVVYGQQAVHVAEQIVALRAALKALVDASEAAYRTYYNQESGAVAWQTFVELDLARAAAVALLGEQPA